MWFTKNPMTANCCGFTVAINTKKNVECQLIRVRQPNGNYQSNFLFGTKRKSAGIKYSLGLPFVQLELCKWFV